MRSAAVLLVTLLASPAQEPQALPQDLRSVAWRPADGRYLLVDRAGNRATLLGPGLRWKDSQAVPGPVIRRAACYLGRWLVERQDGRREFLRFVNGGLVLEGGEVPQDWPGPASRPAPAGRALEWSPGGDRLRLGRAPWERPPEIEWGPGWGTLRIRAARPLGPYVEWRVEDGPIRRVAVVPDPRDPLLQRARLEPAAPGARIRLRFRPPLHAFPASRWTPWRELRAPEVDPAGVRPVIRLGD